MKLSKLTKSFIIILIILTADQILKFWIKTHLSLGEEIKIFGNWFIILFVENNGMAFGFEFAGGYGKIFLSVFRIIAVIAIGWYLVKLSRRDIPMGFIACIALIFAGAIGNIIDSAFYGLIFDHSYGQVAKFMPDGGGYSTFLHGKVVDMFYFPLIQGHYPDWLPFWGGNQFIFFRPVFNIADSSITVGIFSILLFYRKYFNSTMKEEEKGEVVEGQESQASDI
ncbi:Lipoprotein signal peptidase [hydrothermal vent metagenome]|uniref:Lipoprotein signal peptidase n=1 Tax=hydrothermal vent metagenome TaxID=652676 RepID=A0A3B0UIQ5_9ZZZZ